MSAGLQGLASAAEGGAILPTTTLLQPDAATFITTEPIVPTVPKAYLNWIFFDDQFRFVASGSGSQQVTANSDSVNHIVKTDILAGKSGYVYIYVSNADSLTTVYFDNLQVTQVHGPLTEEEHFYPFGLLMSGISDQALSFGKYNNYRYNGKEEQHKEFSDQSGLEWYDYGARMYDNQVGRWMVVDPLSEKSRKWTPYNYAYDNPVRFVDPDGMEVIENSEGTTYTGDEAVEAFRQLQQMSSSKGEVNKNNSDQQNESDAPDPDGGKNKKKQQQNQTQNNDQTQQNDQQLGYQPPPKTLPGFPDAGPREYNNESKRMRWKLPDGTILEWDKQHGELEKYDKSGKNHLGSFDPKTGEQIKEPKPGRTTPKFEGTTQPNIFMRAAMGVVMPVISILARNYNSTSANQAAGATLGSEVISYIGAFGALAL